MKNTLLTTTVLALTGFASSANAVEITVGAVKVDIGGFYVDILIHPSVDTDGVAGREYNSLGFSTNTKIHFKPSITLDNGLKIKGTIELEDNTDGDQIDKSYIAFSGGLGKAVDAWEIAGDVLLKAVDDLGKAGGDDGDGVQFIF